MTEVPRPTAELRTTGSALNGSGGSTGAGVGSGPSPAATEARPGQPTGGDEEFDACVQEIRRRMGSNTFLLLPRLEDLLRRWLGMAPYSAGAAALAGVVGVGTRLALALIVTALTGQSTGIPWGRWAVVLAFFGVMDATQPRRMPPPDVPPPRWMSRFVEDSTALLPTVVRTSDLQDLAAWTRRWVRLPVGVGVGVAVATVMLLGGWLYAPTAMGELPAGSLVLLAFLLSDFAAVVPPFDWALVTREARYDHHLFWLSPADSPAVQRQMRTETKMGLITGGYITLCLLLVLILVPWGSPLALALAAEFIVIGYLYTIASAVGVRVGIQKIVERARDERLEGLRHRIETFEPSYANLSPQEAKGVQGLLLLYREIRDAPATPTATNAVLRAIVGLIVPTILFVLAVLGEVYAERIFDAILP